MKRYAVVYTTDAFDESDARRQFWDLYAGKGYTIRCVAQI